MGHACKGELDRNACLLTPGICSTGKGEAIEAILAALEVVSEPFRSFANTLVDVCAYAGLCLPLYPCCHPGFPSGSTALSVLSLFRVVSPLFLTLICRRFLGFCQFPGVFSMFSFPARPQAPGTF